ncbi:HAD family hydrolase [Algoriphagus namhaensis]
MNKTLPLQQVIDGIKASKQLPIVIFDLDDTLFSTARRNLIIIQSFAADYGQKYPDFAAVAQKLTLEDMNWSVSIALTKAGLDASSPGLEFFNKEYWGSRFFSDEFVSLDLPNPGAVDFANACHDAGAMLFYLTGRHRGDPGMNNGMGQGTVLSFTDRGFPYWRGRCELNLKFDKSEPDASYKTRALADVRSLQGQVIATFDNEPKNVVIMKDNFPEAMNFWVKTTWNPDDKPDPFPHDFEIPDFAGWYQCPSSTQNQST